MSPFFSFGASARVVPSEPPPPSSASLTNGSGTLTLSDLWREEGTATTVSSDQGIGGTDRIKLNTVHPCSFDQDTVDEIHLRMRLGGLNTTAHVYLKDDGGTFDYIDDVTVTTSPYLSEIYLVSGIDVTDVQDYIDSSGNITVRIVVPGPLLDEYSASFDQVLVRSLRASETE